MAKLNNSRNSTSNCSVDNCSVDNCSVDNKATSREEIPAPRRTSETEVFPERERRDGPGGE